MSPANEAELSDAVAGASGALRVVGGGTRSIGAARAGEVLSLSELVGIEMYDPGALTLVAKAGTPLDDIEAALSAEGQMLAFEPTDMRALLGRDGASTIGGVVAANASGPRRLQAGACRDSLLGVRFVDGRGDVLKNGGRVMKNVTGYDLVKLMAGSYGTLGVMSEVALKVLPKLDGATVVVRDADALEVMTQAMMSPFEVSGAAAIPGEGVFLRLEGLEVSVQYRTEKLRALLGKLGEIEVISDPAQSAALWRRLRDVTDFADGTSAVWRVSMKPSDLMSGLMPALGGGLDVQYDWAGGLAWLRMGTGIDDAQIVEMHEAIQTGVTAHGGGHATLFKAPDAVLSRVIPFQPETPGVALLAKGLRAKFDPRAILNPGLMGAA
ncbi:FAD-binding protein [Rhodobacteraceae bacterium N5(2021)]|uniref:FAD-binding protein n=1 Tax=Gymnodinialimonas phycosphaerae TaxID=2841589 RepID=A0A975TYP1_9RHOB|nr:FAD-binding protein [Gymnodinialimonas phycosphaerae]MBY4894768.1 FAD-binding protein [Gymnodinialimonas phycosphaerae]